MGRERLARRSDDDAISDLEERAKAEYLASLETPEVQRALTETKGIAEQLYAEGRFIPDTKRRDGSCPWAGQDWVCRRHGIEVFVLADAEGRPVIKTFPARDYHGVRLLAPDTWPPSGTMFRVECDGSKSYGDLVAGFKRVVREYRGDQKIFDLQAPPETRPRLSGHKLHEAVQIHHAYATSGQTWEDIGRLYHLSRSAVSRRTQVLDREYGIPPPRKNTRFAPSNGLCGNCPDGGCAGCKYAAAVREVEVSSKDQIPEEPILDPSRGIEF